MKKEIKKVAKISADPLSDKLSELRKIIPGAFAEDKIDWEKLKATLGGEITTGIEKYGLNWAGKSNAFKAIRIPATGTLVPQEKESKDWDTTENIFIEGDNLEVLKLLQKHYRGQIKMCYIDPPYNTGKDFIYKDNFTENISDYYERTGQSKDGIKLVSNMESNGRYHSDWLTMMYPRLFLAKNLLKDDGVIFVSIDDNEVANLRMIMDEIFGEENFIADIIWEKKYSPQNDATYFSDMHDYVLCYAKRVRENKNSIDGFVLNLMDRTAEQNARYQNPDNDPRGDWKSSDMSVKTYSANYDFEIVTPTGRKVNPPSSRCWRFGKEKYAEMLADNRIWFGSDGNGIPSVKRFLSEVQQGIVPSTLWFREDVGDNQEAAKEIRDLFKIPPFDTPKPTRLIKRMLELSTANNSNDIVLDFFAGSGTTAHAVMAQNAEDGGNRKWICVQIPEEIDKESETYKTGYKNIAEISRERIRRAAVKIEEEVSEKRGEYNGLREVMGYKEREIKELQADAGGYRYDFDDSFKSLKLMRSNYRQWNVLTDKEDEQKLKAQMKLFVERPLIDEYEEKTVVFEILTKEGFDINAKVEKKTIEKMKVWAVSDSEKKMFVSFAKKLTKEQVEDLKLTESDMFVCFDSALDDTTKVNLMRNFNVKVI